MEERTPGPLESAVIRHGASPLVRYEAAALDRQLELPQPDWLFLLGRVEEFCRHYPALLVSQPQAFNLLLETAGRALSSSGGAVRERAALVLLELVLQAVEQGQSLQLPAPHGHNILQAASRALSEFPQAAVEPRIVDPALRNLLRQGKLIISNLAERPVEQGWSLLLEQVSRLALSFALMKLRLAPRYDGHLDGRAEVAQVARSLQALRVDRISGLEEQIRNLRQELTTGRRTAIEVVLELFTFRHSLEQLFDVRGWLQTLEEALRFCPPPLRQELMRLQARWLEETGDRQMLAELAGGLLEKSDLLVTAGLDNGGARLMAEQAAARLEAEAGRGGADEAVVQLWRLGAELTTKLLAASPPSRADLLELALRLRTGPVEGAPFAALECGWWLSLAADNPQQAQPLLLRPLAGLLLEKFTLSEPRREKGKLLAALARILAIAWPQRLWLAARSILRLAPLPAFTLGGESLRALAGNLQARGGYLLHTGQRLLDLAPERARELLEALLESWHTVRPEPLFDWLVPEELAGFEQAAETRILQDCRRVLQGLRRALGAREGWGFLERIGAEFERPDTIVKIAGFSGLAEEVPVRLALVFALRRRISGRLAQPRVACADPSQLLQAGRELASQRRELVGQMRLAGENPSACLGLFVQELELAARAEAVLEWLVRNCEGEKDLFPQVCCLLLEHGGQSSQLPQSLLELAGSQGLKVKAQEFHKRFSEILEEENAWWRQALAPHVADSARRLRENPLARAREPAGAGQMDLLGHAVRRLLESEEFLPLLKRLVGPLS